MPKHSRRIQTSFDLARERCAGLGVNVNDALKSLAVDFGACDFQTKR